MLVRDNWFYFPQPTGGPLLRLFCFPYAGGGASVFRTWQRRLPAGVEVCAVQFPGRESRFGEAPYTGLGDLVPALAGAVEPYTDVPFAFFGHSMGALVAFALACELRNRQRPGPVHLMVSGRRAPQRPYNDPPIHGLPEDQFLEELRLLKGTPDVILGNMELMNLLLPVLRADFTLCETYEYVPAEPLECPISAFGGIQDPKVSREDIAAWREQTTGPLTQQIFPGGHFYLLEEPSILLDQMARQLGRIVAVMPRR